MAKNTKDAAKFIRSIIPAILVENYLIKDMFKSISSEEKIRNGVVGFRDFLYRLCDYIINDNDLNEKTSREVHEFMDNSSLPIDFPILNNLQSILVNTGFYGTLSDDNSSLLIENWELLTIVGNANINSQTKMVLSKFFEGLRYLRKCGLNFEGIDIDTKKPNMSNISQIKISYADNAAMLIGLKTMAIAQKRIRTSGHEDYFLCCNYKVLMDGNPENSDIDLSLRDFVNPLNEELGEFVIRVHRQLITAGLKVKVEQIKYLRFRFTYFKKSKEFCTFSASIKGYSLIIKANNIIYSPEIIKDFPLDLKEKILKGFGCYRKIGGDHCIGGCQGFRFPLNESLLKISNYIKIWLENELSF